jgi:hypothetical protein
VEGDPSFAVACGESAEVFESAEATLDAVTEFVKSAIMGSLLLPADFGRDHCHSAHRFDRGHDCVRVIAPIRHDDLRRAAHQQRQRFGELPSLTTGEPEGDRLTQAVGQQMDLRAQSTSGTPQSLIFAPFFRPVAACW